MASGGKAKKMRGNHTHGRGKKAGRGAGLRGGRGRAGANKHRYLMLQLLGGKHEHTRAKPWGRIGFKYRSRDGNPRPESINVGDVSLLFAGQADVDLTSKGIGKLLGSGAIAHKVTIKVEAASAGFLVLNPELFGLLDFHCCREASGFFRRSSGAISVRCAGVALFGELGQREDESQIFAAISVRLRGASSRTWQQAGGLETREQGVGDHLMPSYTPMRPVREVKHASLGPREVGV